MKTTALQELSITPSNLTFNYTLPAGVESLVGKTAAEVLDIFALEGNENEGFLMRKIGEKERKSVHKAGDLHLIGRVWLFNSRGEVVLQKRSLKTDVGTGLLSSSAGGHIKSGQTILSGVVEEVSEELGLQIQESDLIPLGYISKPGHENNELMGIFAAPFEGNINELILQAEEVDSVQSIHIDVLENDWSDSVRSKAHTVKPLAYQQMIIQGIRKILNNKR